MKTTKKLAALLVIGVLFVNVNFASAANITIKNSNVKIITNETQLNRSEIFEFFAGYYKDKTPESYKYISLNFTDIYNQKDKTSLQTLIYHNLIQNNKANLRLNKKMNAYNFYMIAQKVFNIELILNKENLLKRNTNYLDLKNIKQIVTEKNLDISTTGNSSITEQKRAILNDVYKTILDGHYDKEKLTEEQLINSAIEGIAKGTNDKHTVYFPPVKFKSFNEHLAGEYEGIGSYVELKTPGEFIITSPIPGGPAERAGLKGGDQVIKVDGKEIDETHPSEEIISWIKGPAGTTVELTIKRGEEELVIKVKREKIELKNIESDVLEGDIYYIRLKAFGVNIANDFKAELEKIKQDPRIDKIIIDLRNNGGGYLSEVTKMLSYLVDKGETTAVVKYQNKKQNYISKNENLIDLNDYKVVILQNSGTASASEIMIGTLRDYFSHIQLIGEKTYGKGSVQNLKQYKDGSSLKFTIAKWFTGKTETGIDGVGIEPTIKLELDLEKYKENAFDNQLEKAIELRY